MTETTRQKLETSSDATTGTDRIDKVGTALEKVREQAEKISSDLHKSKQRIRVISWIMSIILIVVGFGFLLVALDYWKNNEERYERFIDKTEELKIYFFPKKDADPLLEQNNRNVKTLGCLKNKGYFSIKCFE